MSLELLDEVDELVVVMVGGGRGEGQWGKGMSLSL